MRQSRHSQFLELKGKLDALSAPFIRDCFPNGAPDAFYQIAVDHVQYKGVGYHIARCLISKIRYNWSLPWYDKRPSVEQLDAVRYLVENPPAFSRDKVLIDAELQKLGATLCWSVPLIHFDNSKPGWPECAFDKETLEPELERLISVYVPKEGQFKCQYCSKATNTNSKYVGTIISRSYPGMQKQFDYCSERCCDYDQMGHEG